MFYVLCKHSLFEGATETVFVGLSGDEITPSIVIINSL
jgi:hypothetical protein